MSGNRQFDVIQVEKPNRNGFDLSHSCTTSFNMGQLVPVSCMEVIPGDNFTIGAESLVRFAPLVSPVMHRFDARIEYFYVPNRLVWSNWNKFIAQSPTGPGVMPVVPTIDIAQGNYTPLMDYFGIPTPIAPNVETVNAIPFAAYQLIYDQYYRDQNLIPSVPAAFTLIDGDNTGQITSICNLKNRCWEHDIFTSALPFAQKGNPVTLGNQPFDDVRVLVNHSPIPDSQWAVPGATIPSSSALTALADMETVVHPAIDNDALYADTSALSNLSVTVNQLRDSIALQKWLEINARAGTRINEVIEGHFDVKPDDARIQRPEYIVGVKTPISISEVLSNAETTDLPQGNMAGHGVGAITDPNFGSYFAKEHGYIIGIMSLMPKTAYQQGIEKHWLKTIDPTQYFWPSFAGIGEQPVQNKEVYAFQNVAGEDTFGYMPAYYDYRTKKNLITGDFKTTLSSWQCGRIFSSPPALNDEFVTADPRTDIFAVIGTLDQHIYVQVINKVFASRLIPEYGTPGLPTL